MQSTKQACTLERHTNQAPMKCPTQVGNAPHWSNRTALPCMPSCNSSLVACSANDPETNTHMHAHQEHTKSTAVPQYKRTHPHGTAV